MLSKLGAKLDKYVESQASSVHGLGLIVLASILGDWAQATAWHWLSQSLVTVGALLMARGKAALGGQSPDEVHYIVKMDKGDSNG